MNKLYNRIICTILVLSMAAIAGCGNSSNPGGGTDSGESKNTDTSNENQVETELVPDLPAYDGKGRDFTILAKMDVI